MKTALESIGSAALKALSSVAFLTANVRLLDVLIVDDDHFRCCVFKIPKPGADKELADPILGPPDITRLVREWLITYKRGHRN